ncbi:MAG: hypothetical protein KDD44_09680, partial [Bdellovibrionales bacterium]|nr:hypothetical protein [Bdellovibrionales bacterium]
SAGAAPREARSIGLSKPAICCSAFPGTATGAGPSVAAITLYHYGTISIRFEFPRRLDSIDDLANASSELKESLGRCIAAAREQAGRMLDLIRAAVRKPMLRECFEDYAIFSLRLSGNGAEAWIKDNGKAVAQALRLDPKPLSGQAVERTLCRRVSHYEGDLAILSWNSALFINASRDEAAQLVEFMNAQLLATRVTRVLVDAELQRSFGLLKRPFWRVGNPNRVGEMRGECAYLFADLKHALAQLRDEHLAAIHDGMVDVLELNEAEEAITNLLAAIEGISSTLYNRATIIRMEALTIVIILLIAIEIVMNALAG